MSLPPEIHVCTARTCLAKGAEACLLEIEELAGVVGSGCRVRSTGCLGYCSQGPNALVVAPRIRGSKRTSDESIEVEVRNLEASMRVVERATGHRPNPEDPNLAERFSQLRAARALEQARANFHWNRALCGLGEEAAADPALRSEIQRDLLAKAGFPDAAVGGALPESIQNYTRWSLESVTPLSRHSALYSLTSTDRKRSTPHPRGREKQPVPVTFHTTLLAEVGRNAEGPLPWVEREYTPVSTAKDWDAGRCELLVKIYEDGLATSWLLRTLTSPPAHLWLSTPVRTLFVPGLVPDHGGMGSAFASASVLLLLAGTGVVALPQILAHRDPINKLGISTPRRWQLRVPIDLLLSCREDDVLLLPEIAQWCRDGETTGLRHGTLMLTPPNGGSSSSSGSGGDDGDDPHHRPPPFSESILGGAGDGHAVAEETLKGLANARVLRSRLCPALVAEAAARMPRPCRVVVSGPGGFNSAAREMLGEFFGEEEITVLAA